MELCGHIVNPSKSRESGKFTTNLNSTNSSNIPMVDMGVFYPKLFNNKDAKNSSKNISYKKSDQEAKFIPAKLKITSTLSVNRTAIVVCKYSSNIIVPDNDNIVIIQFINECCDTSNIDNIVMSTSLFETYKDWCDFNNINPLTHIMFSKKIAKKYRKIRRNRGTFFKGIALFGKCKNLVKCQFSLPSIK